MSDQVIGFQVNLNDQPQGNIHDNRIEAEGHARGLRNVHRENAKVTIEPVLIEPIMKQVIETIVDRGQMSRKEALSLYSEIEETYPDTLYSAHIGPMIDAIEKTLLNRREGNELERWSMKVWVAVHNNAGGIGVRVYESETAAYAGMAKLIRDFGWWGEAVEESDQQDRFTVAGETNEPLPRTPPENDRECVEEYFNVMAEADGYLYESLQVDQFTVRSLDEIRGVVNG